MELVAQNVVFHPKDRNQYVVNQGLHLCSEEVHSYVSVGIEGLKLVQCFYLMSFFTQIEAISLTSALSL